MCKMEFAAILNAKMIFYDCGHYIHHYKSDEMCKEIINFVNSLENNVPLVEMLEKTQNIGLR